MKRTSRLAAGVLWLATALLNAQDKTDPPTAAAVIQRYIDVTGGKAAYDANNSEISTGTFSVGAAGINGTIKEYAAAPAKAYAAIDIPGVGLMEEGTDGKIAWENSALQGARILTGDEGAAAMRKAASDAVTNWKKYYKSAELAGTDTVDGKTCYKVVMTPEKGPAETDCYDRETGYLVKTSATYDTPMGPVPSEMLMSDYRKQGDMTIPFHIQEKLAGQQFDIKLDKVELNASVPDSRFEPPSAVKALMK